ncbi:nucleotidyltransferase domain-containing protein [Paenibacillus lycopersici]|uniref:Nucleotidyltransferase domain-containing protein n=1 Tax=Paenibacillus lycopersici TaxID=2704462 RepID=A0A6C0FY04_9BACL|nr:nucleotidyltransferase domain-containing protein [Paenibacillus lycopersici]
MEQDLPGRAKAETAVLRGSDATGRATERSDVDLCCIGQHPCKRFAACARTFSIRWAVG